VTRSPALAAAEVPPTPAEPTRDERIERTLRVSVWEGAFTTVFINWTTGAVLTGYMLYYNATALQLALIGCVPLLAGIFSPLAAWIHSNYPRPTLLVTILALVGRSIWLLPALMPVLGLAPEGMPGYVLIVLSFSHIFQSMAGTIWTMWMGKVVPEKRRGRYFGMRGGIHAMVGLSASLGAGVFLDHVAAPFNYQATLCVAVAMALVGIWLYGKHYDPPAMEHRLTLREIVLIPLRDRNFRRFLWFATYWQLAVLLASGFVYPYYIGHLGMSFTQIAIFQSIAAVTTLVCSPLWGKLADKVGNKAVLSINVVVVGAFLPMTWLLAVPGDPTMVFVSGFVDGLGWSAVNPAVFNLSLASAPPERRVAYIGMLSMFAGLGGFAGGLISAGLMNVYALAEYTFVSGGVEFFTWSAYHTLFVTSALFRVSAILLIRPIRESHAWGSRQVLRAMFNLRSVGFFWR